MIIKEARYYNACGSAVAIIATITEGIDWAAYIGGTDGNLSEEETGEWVSQWGCKLSSRDARYYFPNIKLPYRD